MTQPRQDAVPGSVIAEPNGVILVICELFSVGALVLANLALITCDYVSVETPELHKFSMGYLLRQHIQCDSNLFSFEARYCKTYDECYSYYLEDDYKGHLKLYDKIWIIGRAFCILAHVVGVSAVLVPYSTFLFAAHRQKQIFQVLTGLYIAGALLICLALIAYNSGICKEFTCKAGLGVYCTIGSSLAYWVSAIVCILGVLPKGQSHQSPPNNTSSNERDGGGQPHGTSATRDPLQEAASEESEGEISISNYNEATITYVQSEECVYAPLFAKSSSSQDQSKTAVEEEKEEEGEEVGTHLAAFMATLMDEHDNSCAGANSDRQLDELYDDSQEMPLTDSHCCSTISNTLKMKPEEITTNNASSNDILFEVEEGAEIEIATSNNNISLNSYNENLKKSQQKSQNRNGISNDMIEGIP